MTVSPVPHADFNRFASAASASESSARPLTTVVATDPAVTQFWTFEAAKLLAASVYSREYPALKPLRR